MPNGHLPETPKIDHTSPNGPVLQWLVSAVTLVYHGVGEVKSEQSSLAMRLAAVESEEESRSRLKAALLEAARQEAQSEARWWSGLKLRAETVLAGLGIAGGAWALLSKLL